MRHWITPLAAFFLMFVAACGKSPPPPPSQSQGESPGQEEEGPSDLDRSADDLFSAVCQHQIPAYTCDQCRWEVGVVKVPPELLSRKGGLEVGPVEKHPGFSGRALNGEVKLNEERAVFVSPRVAGVVRRIRVDIGLRVGAGQILFDVDSPDLGEAQAQYIASHAALELAEATFHRESDLFSRRICPEKDLLEAKAAFHGASASHRAARERLLRFGMTGGEVESLGHAESTASPGLLPVRAPFPGTVLERSLSLGAPVEPGQKVLLLADTSKVWVLTALYEREVAEVVERQASGPVAAEVSVSAYPGRIFRGALERIGGTLDEGTRTATARVVVPNPDGLLRAGMFAAVHLQMETSDEVLALPEEAVLEDEGRSFVFVRRDAEHYVRRPVSTGRTRDGWVEIKGGLNGGESVVTRGAFLLKSDVLRSKMGAGCAD